MPADPLLDLIVVNPAIFGGKPIVRGRRLAVEHVLGMLAHGDTPATILAGYPWLEREDIQACMEYARRLVAREGVERHPEATSQRAKFARPGPRGRASGE